MAPSLSIVIPCFNEREWIGKTVTAAAAAVLRSPFRDAEIVVVDDGSAEPTKTALAALRPAVPLRILTQHNRGPFLARRTGLLTTRGEYVLLLDSRVTLDPEALRFAAAQIGTGRRVWNGHVEIERSCGPYARFWDILTQGGFPAYFKRPRHVSFGLDEYDEYPKGTGHFLAPRSLLLEAIEGFSSHYDDLRFVSCDTHLLRHIAAREPINLAPSFRSTYHPRTSLRPFLIHAMYRGTTFVDSFGRPGSRFFGVVLAMPPASLLALAVAVTRPRLALSGLLGTAGAATAFAVRQGRSPAEAAVFGTLLPPFGMAFVSGVWRGLVLAARSGNRTA